MNTKLRRIDNHYYRVVSGTKDVGAIYLDTVQGSWLWIFTQEPLPRNFGCVSLGEEWTPREELLALREAHRAIEELELRFKRVHEGDIVFRSNISMKKKDHVRRLGSSIERRQLAKIPVPAQDYKEYRLYTGVDLKKQ